MILFYASIFLKQIEKNEIYLFLKLYLSILCLK